MDKTFEKAEQYEDNEEYAKAYEEYLKLANIGNTAAMDKIAMMYANGKGVEQNDRLTYEWFYKSACQGDRLAQYNMGVAYKWGLGTDINYQESIKWFEKAAQKGSEQSMIELMYLYAGEVGHLKPDIDMTIQYIEKVSQISDEEANMGLNVLKQNTERFLSERQIVGKIFLKQSDAQKAAMDCLNGYDFGQTMMTLADIFLFPEYDDSLLSNYRLFDECEMRKYSLKKENRVIPTYIAESSKLLGRFGFMIEDETNIFTKSQPESEIDRIIDPIVKNPYWWKL